MTNAGSRLGRDRRLPDRFSVGPPTAELPAGLHLPIQSRIFTQKFNLRIRSPYWLCQILGWGTAGLYWSYFTIFQKPSLEGILVTVISVGTCIGITHAYKLFAHRHQWHQMGIAQLIPRILAALLFLACAYTLFNLSINYFFWKEPSYWENAVNIAAGGIRYNAIWLLIFHFYHFSRRKGSPALVDIDQDESFEMLPSRGFNGQTAAVPEQIFVKDGEKCFFIPIEQIERIEALGNYVQIFFDGRKAVAKRSLAEVEDRLDAGRFFRANRAAIISLKHIGAVKALSKGKLSVVMQSGTEVVLSERKSVQFKAQLSL